MPNDDDERFIIARDDYAEIDLIKHVLEFTNHVQDAYIVRAVDDKVRVDTL